METIRHKLTIGVPLKDVFQTITRPEGVSRWLTPDLRLEPEHETVAEIRFNDTFIRAWVKYYERNTEIRWVFFNGHEYMREWVGTTATFSLEETEEEDTILRFYHGGWKKPSDHFMETSFMWAQALYRLETYLETGVAEVLDEEHHPLQR